MLAVAALSLLSADIGARAQAILIYRSSLADRNTNLDTFAQLQKDAPAAAGYQAAIGQLLPSQDDLINFPQDVTTAAKSFNVNTSVSFQGEPAPATASSPGYVGFSLRASGTNANLLAFLKYIESQSTQFLLTVDSVDLAVSDPSSQLSVAGRVFSQ